MTETVHDMAERLWPSPTRHSEIAKQPRQTTALVIAMIEWREVVGSTNGAIWYASIVSTSRLTAENRTVALKSDSGSTVLGRWPNYEDAESTSSLVHGVFYGLSGVPRECCCNFVASPHEVHTIDTRLFCSLVPQGWKRIELIYRHMRDKNKWEAHPANEESRQAIAEITERWKRTEVTKC